MEEQTQPGESGKCRYKRNAPQVQLQERSKLENVIDMMDSAIPPGPIKTATWEAARSIPVEILTFWSGDAD